MKRALYVLFCACLLSEHRDAYAQHWVTPLRQLSIFLFEAKPLAVPFIDLILLGFLLATKPVPGGRGNPIMRALLASLIALGAWSVWGVVRGGSAYQIQFQLHMLVVSYLLAVVMRRVLTTPEDYLTLMKVMIGAALYRASMCVAFYLAVMRPNILTPPPEFATSHDDTVLFVVSLVSAAAYALTHPARRRTRNTLLAVCLILAGIQFNNRRLAWVSLAAALLAHFFALPDPSLRRKVVRYGLRIIPLVAVYVAVGWGRPEPIFRPLRAFASVAPGSVDPSTKSRDAENMGLLVTMLGNPPLGTGWGHEYVEVDDTLSARSFAQYRYLPHNSVLGLLAFTGFVGFACIWMTLPLCAYYALRSCFAARDPTVHQLGIVTLTCVVVCMNQMWGDMGLISTTTLFIMAAGYACASHLPTFEAAIDEREAALLDTSDAPEETDDDLHAIAIREEA